MSGWTWLWLVPFLVAIVLLLIPFRVRYREREFKKRGSAGSIVRAGLMEVQNLLEPEKKIAIVREAEQDREIAGEGAERRAPGSSTGDAPIVPKGHTDTPR